MALMMILSRWKKYFPKIIAIIAVISFFSSCSTVPETRGIAAYDAGQGEQCVPYARRVSGIQIYGNAYTWWLKAAPHHARGYTPRVGAVMVLSKTGKLRHGHLAVVTRVVNARHIEVTHSNWGSTRGERRLVYTAMPVQDISANGDWSRVRFWHYPSNNYGFPYQVSGFIYPNKTG